MTARTTTNGTQTIRPPTINADSGRTLYPTPTGIDVHDTILAAYLQQIWRATHSLLFNGGARVYRDPRFAAVVTPRRWVSTRSAHWIDSSFRSRISDSRMH